MTKAETKSKARANKRKVRNARLKKFADDYGKLYVGMYSAKQYRCYCSNAFFYDDYDFEHGTYGPPVYRQGGNSCFYRLNNSDELVEVTEVRQINNSDLKTILNNYKKRGLENCGWDDTKFIGLCSNFVKIGN